MELVEAEKIFSKALTKVGSKKFDEKFTTDRSQFCQLFLTAVRQAEGEEVELEVTPDFSQARLLFDDEAVQFDDLFEFLTPDDVTSSYNAAVMYLQAISHHRRSGGDDLGLNQLSIEVIPDYGLDYIETKIGPRPFSWRLAENLNAIVVVEQGDLQRHLSENEVQHLGYSPEEIRNAAVAKIEKEIAKELGSKDSSFKEVGPFLTTPRFEILASHTILDHFREVTGGDVLFYLRDTALSIIGMSNPQAIKSLIKQIMVNNPQGYEFEYFYLYDGEKISRVSIVEISRDINNNSGDDPTGSKRGPSPFN